MGALPRGPALVSDTQKETRSPRYLVSTVITTLVVTAAFFRTSALTDISGYPAADASLSLSPAYQILSPICGTLDTISMFSQEQHFAFLITCGVLFTIWRLTRKASPSPSKARAQTEILAACKAVAALAAVYVCGALMPRPAAGLAMSSRDSVVIDFHSHTRYSWDGRSSFSPERSRYWHRENGFDVAYITDHSTFAGAEEAALKNPVRAGDGTVMLSGIEVRDRGAHLVILGTDAADWMAYTAGNLQEKAFQQLKTRGVARPLVILTLPGNLNAASIPVDGIELTDAAPRGLAQGDAERERIVAIGRANRGSLVASSNNHGWANASPAWSVMKIPGWRRMTPGQLDNAIRRAVIEQGATAVRIIERRPRGAVTLAGLSMTVPAAAGRMLTTMSWWERASWLTWVWVLNLILPAGTAVRRWRGRRLKLAA